MPLYDYQCKSCGFELIDVLQRINEDVDWSTVQNVMNPNFKTEVGSL